MSSPWPGGGGAASTAEHEDPYNPAGDRLPEPARRALVSLLMNRYITRARHRTAWEGIVTFENDIRARLDEMYLDLVVDHEAQVAFKRQQARGQTPRPAFRWFQKRRQPGVLLPAMPHRPVPSISAS